MNMKKILLLVALVYCYNFAYSQTLRERDLN